MKCLVCVNVPSECSQCQALMTGAPETVCVCQGVFSRDSDRLRSSVERSRPRYTLKIHTHTHRVQWCVQGVSVVWSLSLHPAGEARANQSRLALPRTVGAERLDLHKSSELLLLLLCKMLFCGEIPSTAELEVRGRSSEHEAGRGCESDNGKITQPRPKLTEPSGALC